MAGTFGLCWSLPGRDDGALLRSRARRPRYTNCLPYDLRMFARKLAITYELDGQPHPCPLKWLDNFSMRNFTNASVFDDTLPVADGRMEVGTAVPLDQLREAMEDWFRRKGYLGAQAHLEISEISGV